MIYLYNGDNGVLVMMLWCSVGGDKPVYGESGVVVMIVLMVIHLYNGGSGLEVTIMVMV